MRQRRPLYRCVAGVEPNNPTQSDPGSERWFWRNLSWSSEIASISPLQPCDFMNNSPLGMNLILLDSWHRAQEHAGVGFRIDCVAVVDCCSCGPGVCILSVVMKRMCRVVSSLRLSAEKPPGSVMAITRF